MGPLVAVLLVLPATTGTFVVLESRPECFTLEQPHHTEMTVKYEIPSLEKVTEADAGRSLHLTLSDRRNEEVIVSKTIADHQGEIELATASESVHLLCLAKDDDGDRPLRVDFEINVGLSDRYYDELATERKMDKLEVEIVKLNDELAEILSEADFMKDKEVKFHHKAERINVAAIWWPMIQLAILIFTALFSVKNLKNFFSAKSLY